LNDKPKNETNAKQRRLRRGKRISFESAILLFGMLNASADQSVIERVVKLALRAPHPLGDVLRAWAASHGEDVDRLLSGEPTTPTTGAEVKALAEPFLKKGAGMATLAQVADFYLFDKERTPENIVYAFYAGTRFALVRERPPTKEESKQIWEITLWIAQTSKIGAPYWEELKRQGPFDLKDWIDERKEDARKKYETFLRKKKLAEETAEDALTSLLTDIFGDTEESPQ
jgi:hypothetical protein